MRSRQLGSWVVGALILSAAMPALAAEAQSPAEEARAVRALVETIDRRIAEKWAEGQVQPSARADDAEFLRRVSLDLAGKIPTAAEARDFLDDPAVDKRERLVESLLASPGYVNHWTSVWRTLLLPEADAGSQAMYLAPDFEAWLRRKVTDNAGQDKIAREIVTLSLEGPNGRRGIGPFDRQGEEPTPLAYYMAKDVKPENLAAGTARTFLGIRIECAQCHDHPFARWKREEFWGYAAFFGGVQQQGPADQFGPIREIPDRRELAIPGTERVVQAGFLDGGEPQWRFKVSPRSTLADWMVAEENPYFARAGVNRLWAQLFGVGLVDPVDDLSDANPPSHPELLDELAAAFAKRGYNSKFLLRALTASRAYQLTSDATGASQNDPRTFARMAVKGMSPEQLYESLAQAAGLPPDPNANVAFRVQGGPKADFVQRFSRRDEKPTETQTSILQALAMMNGRLTVQSTNMTQGATLGAVADAPFLDDAGKVETLFLAALSRKPRPEELERMLVYLNRKAGAGRGGSLLDTIKNSVQALAGGPRPVTETGKNRALADVFWSILNSSEFLLNH